MFPGPGVGWYKIKMKVSKHEKMMIADAGTNIERRKRAKRKRDGFAIASDFVGDDEMMKV